VSLAPPEEIDRVNILQATLSAMARAVSGLRVDPDWVLVDGDRLPAPEARRAGHDCGWECLVRGDGRSATIAAASILAKVVRDRLMRVYARRYPDWGFAEHKGYGTAAHLAALARFGASPIHRRSFRVGGKAMPLRNERAGSEGVAWARREARTAAAAADAGAPPTGAAPEPMARPRPPGTWKD